MKKIPKEKPTIIIDTREQLPYFGEPAKWPGAHFILKGLATGDYSIQGFETSVTIERKSMPDFHNSMFSGHRRFAKELVRLSQMERAFVVVEGEMPEFYAAGGDNIEAILKNPDTTALVRRNRNILISTFCHYGVPFLFLGNREEAEHWTFNYLVKYHELKRIGGLL